MELSSSSRVPDSFHSCCDRTIWCAVVLQLHAGKQCFWRHLTCSSIFHGHSHLHTSVLGISVVSEIMFFGLFSTVQSERRVSFFNFSLFCLLTTSCHCLRPLDKAIAPCVQVIILFMHVFPDAVVAFVHGVQDIARTLRTHCMQCLSSRRSFTHNLLSQLPPCS